MTKKVVVQRTEVETEPEVVRESAGDALVNMATGEPSETVVEQPAETVVERKRSSTLSEQISRLADG